jgi:hypothetical protein
MSIIKYGESYKNAIHLFYNVKIIIEMENDYRSIRIKNTTYEALKKLGSSLDATYDSVVSDLIKKTQKVGEP